MALKTVKNFIKNIYKNAMSHTCCGPSAIEIEEPNLGFWKEIDSKCKSENRPIFVLAPMADVTDCAFRYVIAKYGMPDVLWTEFVAADGLVRATEEGKKKLLADLKFSSELEHPIVAQLFGSHPQYMEEACKLVAELGFDGIDLNMGCPDKSIEKQGAGASMMKNPKLAKEIVLAAKRGVERASQESKGDSTGEKSIKIIPITVKTRVGYNKDELDSWLKNILEAAPAVVTVHARTRKEMSKVPANWDYVNRAVLIRNKMQSHLIEAGKNHTLIFGNGDVESIEDGYKKAKDTGADGVMIGRAIFGNPWLFSTIRNPLQEPLEPSIKEKLNVMVEHTQKFQNELGGIKNFAVMKKHYKAYVNGFDGAKELRAQLMETQNAGEVRKIVEDFIAEI
ncbi:MAG: tRNA-dihydrouridine synthase [bacterium]